MNEYIPVLRRTQIFAGVSNDEIRSMLLCLDARLRHYKKGEYVLREGEHLNDIMILADGRLHIQKDDYWGNRSILEQISMGEMFGEAYTASESGPLLNDVVAAENSAVIFFNAKRIITTCPTACRFHTIVVQNLFFQMNSAKCVRKGCWNLKEIVLSCYKIFCKINFLFLFAISTPKGSAPHCPCRHTEQQTDENSPNQKASHHVLPSFFSICHAR